MIGDLERHHNRLVLARSFVLSERQRPRGQLSAVSLFAGAGLSDLGYEAAGFEFVVHGEKDEKRAILCTRNFPSSTTIVGELRETWEAIVDSYRERCPKERLALLSVTPPCQGMSSSNPGRGKVGDPHTSDQRNLLMLGSLPFIRALRPRVVVVENVPQVLLRIVHIGDGEEPRRLIDVFESELGSQYQLFWRVVQMADYGVPQFRRRAVIVAMHLDEPSVAILKDQQALPLPPTTHAERPQNGQLRWVTLEEWLMAMAYPPLDASPPKLSSDESDPLHFVPTYDGDRYLMVADIPPRSGRSAYQNSVCHACGRADVPEGEVTCPGCGALMRNRPYVRTKNGGYRLIRGFKSSYRRMYPDRPAATVTTASSHIGSDYKIHPWENRVLSIRECADLQTVPHFYDWSWAIETSHTYLARQVIGEALPPLFTFLHGGVLRDLLDGLVDPSRLASA